MTKGVYFGLCLSMIVGPLAWASEPSVTVLVGGRLIDGTGSAPVDEAAIVIRGDRILAAGPEGLVTVPPGATIIRVDGESVLPGLIESNGHVSYSGQWNSAVYFVRELEHYYEIGARNLHTSLMQGITAVRDTMGPLTQMLQLRADVESGKIAGSRLFTCGTILNSPGPFRLKKYEREIAALPPALVKKAQEWTDLDIRDGAHGREVVRLLASRGVDFVKVSVISEVPNDPPELSLEVLRQIVDEAHRLGLKVTSHTGSVETVQRAVQAGVDSMEHPELTSASGDFEEEVLPDETIEEIVRRRVYSIPLIVYAETYLTFLKRPSLLDDPSYIAWAPAGVVQEAREGLRLELEGNPNAAPEFERSYADLGRRNLRKLIVADAPIAMGTDKGTRLNFHEAANHVREMEIYVELGMSPMEAIVSATRRGAELLGRESDLGTIEAGKLADIIVVHGDPLREISALRRVDMVFKGGVRYK